MSILVSLYDWVNRRATPLAVALACLAVAAAVVLILSDGGTPRSQDELDFLAIAGNLTSGGGYAQVAGEPTAYRAPGIVFLAALPVAFGGGLTEARLVNALVYGLGLMALFLLVRRHASPVAALLAVAMVPLWPVTLYSATTLYPQTLGAALLVATLWRIDVLADDGRPRNVALAGALCGALVLTLPVTLLLFPLWLFWIWRSARRWGAAWVVFCLVSGTVVSGWTLRNYLAFDAFVPVATSSGYNLLVGNAPDARFDTSTEVRFPEHVYTEITGKSEVERQDIMTRAALDLMAADPARTLWLYGGKFLHWFDYSNRLTSDDVIEGGASSVGRSTRDRVLLIAYLAVIAGPLLLHVALSRRVPFRPIEILFLAFWIGAGLIYALYFTRVRFRAPFDWFVIASNAMFLAGLAEHRLERWRARRKP